jgi:hypothetical protein
VGEGYKRLKLVFGISIGRACAVDYATYGLFSPISRPFSDQGNGYKCQKTGKKNKNQLEGKDNTRRRKLGTEKERERLYSETLNRLLGQILFYIRAEFVLVYFTSLYILVLYKPMYMLSAGL